MVQCTEELKPVMTQGWAVLTHTGVENNFRYNWCRTTGTFYLCVQNKTLHQETQVDKAKAHKYLIRPLKLRKPQI